MAIPKNVGVFDWKAWMKWMKPKMGQQNNLNNRDIADNLGDHNCFFIDVALSSGDFTPIIRGEQQKKNQWRWRKITSVYVVITFAFRQVSHFVGVLVDNVRLRSLPLNTPWRSDQVKAIVPNDAFVNYNRDGQYRAYLALFSRNVHTFQRSTDIQTTTTTIGHIFF